MLNCKSKYFLFYPFSLAVKLSSYLHINRIDLASKTLATMKLVEEDSCLIILASCWLNLNDAKAAVNCHENMIKGLNELSDKFGYTVKTYNVLAIILMI
jgi:hypothetical protein